MTIYQKNIELLRRRFPQLYALNEKEILSFKAPLFAAVVQSKDGLLTAQDGGVWLHSRYSVKKEAASLLSCAMEADEAGKAAGSVLFFGAGLGHTVALACKEYPQKNIIVVEPSVPHFLSALALVDWAGIFAHPSLVLILGGTVEQCETVINHYGALACSLVNPKQYTHHSQKYFDALLATFHQHIQKEKINKATQARFASLWERNCRLNAPVVQKLPSIAEYRGAYKNVPITVVAAGPSLFSLLPCLKEIARRSVLVCVDSALAAVLSAGVEPHFILLTDPQKAAFDHIARCKSPSSVLVAPIEVYPPAFRFSCKKVICPNSGVPVGVRLQGADKAEGNLETGGSVACSALNFAFFLQGEGAVAKGEAVQNIYLIGLDLSFPNGQTHVKGSASEENAFFASGRLATLATKIEAMRLTANVRWAKNYSGENILTDDRMLMFAYYLERRIPLLENTRVLCVGKSGLQIKGIEAVDAATLLALPLCPVIV